MTKEEAKMIAQEQSKQKTKDKLASCVAWIIIGSAMIYWNEEIGAFIASAMS